VRRFITIFLLISTFLGSAQGTDYLNLFSDRDSYISGETILLKIFAPAQEQSGIVHIDLLNPNGKIITGINKRIIDHQADGFIYLPDSLNTGTYLLSSSTNSNKFITVRELFVCNRFTGLTGTSSMLRASDINPEVEKLADIIVEGVQNTYKTRERVKIDLRLTSETLSSLEGDLVISLAEKSPEIDAQSFIQNTVSAKEQKIEKDGIIIEGSVTELDTNKPFSSGCVYLSVPDSIPKLQYFIPGEDGCFSFHLSGYFGTIPVVIQAFDPEKKQLLKIFLNHRDSLISAVPKFSNIAISAASVDFQSAETNNIELTTLRKIFNIQDIAISDTALIRKNDYPFYGRPGEIIHPNNFIELPDFTEIARELLPGVKFRAYNRIPSMQILNPLTQNYFIEQPLVLLNGVPVLDLNVIKNLGTKDIERIELCRNERFYGNLAFHGVVAIYTSKKDLSLLKESDDLVKINLDVLQPQAAINIPKEGKLPNEPDLRKVLLWNPGLKKAETIHLEFSTSDVKGSFKLIIRGKTKDGSIIRKDQIFEVN
jgi:hypothetical protein